MRPLVFALPKWRNSCCRGFPNGPSLVTLRVSKLGADDPLGGSASASLGALDPCSPGMACSMGVQAGGRRVLRRLERKDVLAVLRRFGPSAKAVLCGDAALRLRAWVLIS